MKILNCQTYKESWAENITFSTYSWYENKCWSCDKETLISSIHTQLKSLVKQRTNISGNIEEVERFTTWWSKENIATIITYYNSSYSVFLGVIDRRPNSYGRVENNEIFVYPTNPTSQNWGIYSINY